LLFCARHTTLTFIAIQDNKGSNRSLSYQAGRVSCDTVVLAKEAKRSSCYEQEHCDLASDTYLFTSAACDNTFVCSTTVSR
jgi:hypothetical protein